MNTIQMTLNINIAGGDNWQERLADALLGVQSIVRMEPDLSPSGNFPTGDHIDGNDFTAHYTLFGESVDMRNALNLLDKAATLIYNMEGDQYQSAYEKLESVLDSLGGAK
jgi:hypothetical protein